MTPKRRALMIFAAGLGTRMRPLTDNMPKPLVELGGRPIVDRVVTFGREAGCTPIAGNVHYLPEVMSRYFMSQGIAVSDETTQLLDTGGGLKKALPLLGGTSVFTINPDALWLGENPLKFLDQHWSGSGALLLLVDPGRANARTGKGDFSLTGNRITRGGDLIYSGAQIIDVTALEDIDRPVFSLNAVWDRLAEKGNLHGVVYPGEWCDLGTPEALQLAERLLAAQ